MLRFAGTGIDSVFKNYGKGKNPESGLRGDQTECDAVALRGNGNGFKMSVKSKVVLNNSCLY